MFTGLISDVGEVVLAEERVSTKRLRIACTYPVESIAIGASIACSGPCLTAVATGVAGHTTRLDIDCGGEARARATRAPGWKISMWPAKRRRGAASSSSGV